MVKLGLLILGAAALVSTSPISNDDADNQPFIMTDVEESTRGFHLVAVPTDERNSLASTVKNRYLLLYHYGPGIILPVLQDNRANHSEYPFYLNQNPGNPETILTDGGIFQYSLYVSAPGEKHVVDVTLPVGDVGTPVAISNPGKYGGAYVINGLDTFGEGTFRACKSRGPYYDHAELIQLQYAYNRTLVFPGCVPIRLELQCTDLPAPQSGSISHKYVKTVPCRRKFDA